MRTHTSIKKIESVRTVLNQPRGFKPDGFWYSVDGDWEEWCRAEMPHWLEGQKYEVCLGSENILKISTAKELDEFDDKYAIPLASIEHMQVDWPKVALLYDGIEIAPYQHTKRFTYMWYYVWDCASGCIWSPKGVSLKEIK